MKQRTTFYLDADLYQKAKAHAASVGLSVSRIVEQVLTNLVATPASTALRGSDVVTTTKRKRVAKGKAKRDPQAWMGHASDDLGKVLKPRKGAK